MPLAGVFVAPSAPNPLMAPLNVVFCEACALLQLEQSVEASSTSAKY